MQYSSTFTAVKHLKFQINIGDIFSFYLKQSIVGTHYNRLIDECF